MTQHGNNKRQLILETALDIIEADGIKALTQPKLAKVSGIRQSHLTYYFPRKADLYVALLEASHERARARGPDGGVTGSLVDMLAGLFYSPERMRFFLAIVLEVGDDPELQSVLRRHAEYLAEEISRVTNYQPDDPRLLSFIDEMRGAGLRFLLSPQHSLDKTEQILAMAARHGLKLS